MSEEFNDSQFESGAAKPSQQKRLEISLARRRLMKSAAIATPAVFTLYSGSAQALASGLVSQAQSADQAVEDEHGTPICFEAEPVGGGYELGYETYSYTKPADDGTGGGCNHGGILVAASSLGSIAV